MNRIALVFFCALACSCGRETVAPSPAARPAEDRYDLEYIDTIARHHEITVKVASGAIGRATHPELAALARQLAAGYAPELQQLQTWRDRWYAGAPKAFNEKLPGALAFRSDVGAPTGPPSHSWDVAVVRTLRELQEAAAAMSEEAAQKATHAEVRAFAAAHAPAHRRQAASLAEWESSWAAHDEPPAP